MLLALSLVTGRKVETIRWGEEREREREQVKKCYEWLSITFVGLSFPSPIFRRSNQRSIIFFKRTQYFFERIILCFGCEQSMDRSYTTHKPNNINETMKKKYKDAKKRKMWHSLLFLCSIMLGVSGAHTNSKCSMKNENYTYREIEKSILFLVTIIEFNAMFHSNSNWQPYQPNKHCKRERKCIRRKTACTVETQTNTTTKMHSRNWKIRRPRVKKKREKGQRKILKRIN